MTGAGEPGGERGGKHWRDHEARIAALLGARPFGLATDVDGTICELATAGLPRVGPVLREALATLVERCAVVALISGRPVAAIQSIVDLPGAEVFGIHGLERLRDGQVVLAPGVERWRPAIDAATRALRALAGPAGAAVETKGVTAVIDWRRCPDLGVVPALAASVAAVAETHGLAVLRARMSLELHPPVEIDKGTCLEDLARERGLRGLVYLGDDHSDLTAFRALRRMRDEASDRARIDGLALGVGSAEMPEGLVAAADLVLDGVADVERFFAWAAC